MVLPGMRSSREEQVLADLEHLLPAGQVRVIRPRGRGFDPRVAAQADVVVAELVAADSTPALAWALAAGSLVVGSERLATIGIPALAAGPEDLVERLREVGAARDDAELHRLRQAGLEFAGAVHGGLAVETIERTLFPRPVWDDRAVRGDERETPTQRPSREALPDRR